MTTPADPASTHTQLADIHHWLKHYNQEQREQKLRAGKTRPRTHLEYELHLHSAPPTKPAPSGEPRGTDPRRR